MKKYYAILTHTDKMGEKESFTESVALMSDSDISAKDYVEKAKGRYITKKGFFISEVNLTDETKKIHIWNWTMGRIPLIPIPLGNK